MLALNLNDVTGLGLKPLLTAQYACTEEMNVDIAGPAKHRIFEMMMFQVRDRMAHVFFAGQHRAAPNFLFVSPNTYRSH
jgi:hypothetical protein